MNEQTGLGYLRIWVTSAGETVPITGVPVQILDENGTLLHVLRTGEGGLTPTVALPAPVASDGLTPGTKPYASYGIRVEQTGYVSVNRVDVPVFDGITAVQPVTLLPATMTEMNMQSSPAPLQLYQNRGYRRLEEGGATPIESSGITDNHMSTGMNGSITEGRGTPEIDRLTLEDEEDI